MKNGLEWKNPEGIVLRCVDEIESKKLVSKFHSGFCGGYYAARTTAHKILRAGYCWPSIFLMCISLLELIKPVNYSLENRSLLPCPYNLSL